MTKRPPLPEALKLDPGAIFTHPDDVLNNQKLSIEQKIDILRRWEYDARELSVAEEEGMTSGETSRLAEVLRALGILRTNPAPPDHSPPTKQGGHDSADGI